MENLSAKRVIAIDQGTTGTRALSVDISGRIRSTSYASHQQIQPQPGWVEHDPIEIWESTCQVLKDTLRNDEDNLQVVGIGLANQGETIMAWRRSTGVPIHNAIVWQDLRTQPFMESIAQDEDQSSRIKKSTGLRPDAYFSASKIRWLLKNVSAASELVQAGDLCIGTLDSWLIWKLTGGDSFVTDPSTASRTLLFDIHTLSYDPWLLDLFQVPVNSLPNVRQSTTSAINALGVVQDFGLELDGVPIVTSLVDQPAAVFGHGCLEAGQIKATYGTGCFVYMNTGGKPHPNNQGLLQTICWKREDKTTYALDGGIFAAGSVVEWMVKDLGLINDPKEIDPMLSRFRATDDVICVPSLAGLACPHWSRSARGAFLGMGLKTKKEDLVWAALEGIAARVTQVVVAMEKSTGIPILSLRVDGGLTRCKTLMQMQADMLGVPVEVSAEPEATAMGVAFLTKRALSLWKSDDEIPNHVKIERTYNPSIAVSSRKEKLERFDLACRLVKEFTNEKQNTETTTI